MENGHQQDFPAPEPNEARQVPSFDEILRRVDLSDEPHPDEIRKTPQQVDVEMLTAEREALIEQLQEARREGYQTVDGLQAELDTVNHLLLEARADVIDQQRDQ